jgi:hypothetical protein
MNLSTMRSTPPDHLNHRVFASVKLTPYRNMLQTELLTFYVTGEFLVKKPFSLGKVVQLNLNYI